VRACVCAHACVRACVRMRACVRVCMCVCVCTLSVGTELNLQCPQVGRWLG
jgi:hypothetical protein